MGQPSNGSLQPASSRGKIQIGLSISSNLKGRCDQIDVSFSANEPHKLMIMLEWMTERHGQEFRMAGLRQ
jgi:hypothetical protein